MAARSPGCAKRFIIWRNSARDVHWRVDAGVYGLTQKRAFAEHGRPKLPTMAPRWSEDEDNKIKELSARGMTAREMVLQLPGRTRSTIADRIREMKSWGGFIGRPAARLWTPEETKLLKTLVEDAGLTLSAAREHFPGRTVDSLRSRWKHVLSPQALAIQRSEIWRRYTQHELDQMVRRYEAGETDISIASHLGRSIRGTRAKLRTLIPADHLKMTGSTPFSRFWSSEDITKLCQLYDAHISYPDMEKAFPGRSRGAIRRRIELSRPRVRAQLVTGSTLTAKELQAQLRQLRLEDGKPLRAILELFPSIPPGALRSHYYRCMNIAQNPSPSIGPVDREDRNYSHAREV